MLIEIIIILIYNNIRDNNIRNHVLFIIGFNFRNNML